MEAYNFLIPISQVQQLQLQVQSGEMVFVLGANGAGKSSLMHHFYKAFPVATQRVSAQRQNWFANSGGADISLSQRRQSAENILYSDQQDAARWKEVFSDQRASIALFDLVAAQNVIARQYMDANRQGDATLVNALKLTRPPVQILNDLLSLANIPIELSIDVDGGMLASKNGSTPYDITQLSDGERNTILVAANVLTASPNRLVLIDEPERHLHRSITSSLLTALFQSRPDCAFIISTHDVTLPMDNPTSRTLLVRSCQYNGTTPAHWDVELVPAQAGIDEEIKKDILGARRKIIFVEGRRQSLDTPLYSLVFPNVSVIPKDGCRDVQHTVTSIRDSPDLNWVKAFGIIDNDGRTQTDIVQLQGKGIYALSVHSVESIYFHPEIQRRVADIQARDYSYKASEILENAKSAALVEFRNQIERFALEIAEKSIQDEYSNKKPTSRIIAELKKVSFESDIPGHVTMARQRLQDAISAGDLIGLITLCPIKKSRIPDEIAKALGFQNAEKYQRRVLTLLADDEEAMGFVRSLFGALLADLEAA